ncbi:hypothetical protein [Vibrio lentus]|uniref:ASCH domain-containing protein n=1 Tax=Vibrio lentus TaxID=136468 RepID=A0A855IU18_9VIBR|nr:hypothetical protein [Vibrio lentus]PMM60661.1 hypothetical protein BCT50_22155 [Vibrio lentus]
MSNVRPMIFNTEMVKALLNGEKTVTRRPMKPQPTDSGSGYMWWPSKVHQTMVNLDRVKGDLYWDGVASDMCPLVSVGDLIWVRETFAALGHDDYNQVNPNDVASVHEYRYKASENANLANCPDHEVRGYKWVPSIHMPKHASRLTLKVTDVRIETIAELRNNQAQISSEGFESFPQFKHVWQSVYGDCKPSFYVWVVEFEVINKNVNSYCGSSEVAA